MGEIAPMPDAILSPGPTILAETSAEDGGGAVEIGDRVQVQVGEDTRVRVITLAADRHDPDLGIISVRHPAGTALLGAQEDEEIEFEFDNNSVNGWSSRSKKGGSPQAPPATHRDFLRRRAPPW